MPATSIIKFILQNSIYSFPRCKSLHSFALDILRNVAIFVNILKSLPYLVTFHMNNFADNGTNTGSNVISYKYDHLKHLHILFSDLSGSRSFFPLHHSAQSDLDTSAIFEIFSVRYMMNCNNMTRHLAMDVVIILSIIAEHLPIDCRLDCSLPGRMSVGRSIHIRLRWQRAARDFIPERQRIQVQLA